MEATEVRVATYLCPVSKVTGVVNRKSMEVNWVSTDGAAKVSNGGDIGSGESSRRTGDDSVPDVQNDGVLIGDATLNREVPAAHL